MQYLNAKYTLFANEYGGSPVAFEDKTPCGLSVAPFKNATLKSIIAY